MSQERNDAFREQVAAAIAADMDAEPKNPPKPAPALPEEPELVACWRRIIAYRDDLTTQITKLETAPYALGEIPQQWVKDMRARLTEIDMEIDAGTRGKVRAGGRPNPRGHSPRDLRRMAEKMAEAQRENAARWVDLWLADRSPITRAAVAGKLGRDDLEDIEARVRKELYEASDYRQRAKVARMMVNLADRERG